MSETVPAGFVWVVRNITAHAPGITSGIIQGLEVTVDATVPLLMLHQWQTEPDTDYNWRGHQVLNTGQVLKALGLDAMWTCLVSGYELTLP